MEDNNEKQATPGKVLLDIALRHSFGLYAQSIMHGADTETAKRHIARKKPGRRLIVQNILSNKPDPEAGR